MIEKKGFQIWMPFTLAIFLVGGILIGARMNESAPVVIKPTLTQHRGGDYGRIEELIRYIDAKYVDEVDGEELTERAIGEILHNLDPHSVYIPADKRREIKEQLDGNLDGIGVEFFVLEDTVLVVDVTENGPSERAGILSGDKIVAVDDTLVAGIDRKIDDIISLLRGKSGTEVKVSVLRDGSVYDIPVIRGRISVNSVEVAYPVSEKIGYVKINRFTANTFKDFINALDRLTDDKTKLDLIIDVRENPGGYLQQATNILSQIFREPEKLLVYTEGEHVSRSEYESSGRAIYNIGDVAVLIDERSASASEILAGAIQDYDRGVIIGRRSYGKGLVQEEYNLRDGSALRLTVARYFTPSGRSIQRPYDNLEDYENDLNNRYSQGEMYREKEPGMNDSIFYTDAGRAVYANNGISPDVFVPYDSALLRMEFLELRSYIPAFVYRYLESTDLGDYQDLGVFARNFRVSDRLFADFLTYVRARENADVPDPANRIKGHLKNWIKARVARSYFGDSGYYAVLHGKDATVKKAIEVLENPEPLSFLSK